MRWQRGAIALGGVAALLVASSCVDVAEMPPATSTSTSASTSPDTAVGMSTAAATSTVPPSPELDLLVADLARREADACDRQGRADPYLLVVAAGQEPGTDRARAVENVMATEPDLVDGGWWTTGDALARLATSGLALEQIDARGPAWVYLASFDPIDATAARELRARLEPLEGVLHIVDSYSACEQTRRWALECRKEMRLKTGVVADVRVYVSAGIRETDLADLIDAVANAGGVTSVELLSREAVWAEVQRVFAEHPTQLGVLDVETVPRVLLIALDGSLALRDLSRRLEVSPYVMSFSTTVASDAAGCAALTSRAAAGG